MKPILTLLAILMATSSLASLVGAQSPTVDPDAECPDNTQGLAVNDPDETCVSYLGTNPPVACLDNPQLSCAGPVQCPPPASGDNVPDCEIGPALPGSCIQDQPEDPLYALLCGQVSALPAPFIVVIDGTPDMDSDGRPDTANVTIPVGARQPTTGSPTPASPSPECRTGSTPVSTTTVPVGTNQNLATCIVPTTFYVQLDYFYTPNGLTAPYEGSTSDFDYPITGLMLYSPRDGLPQAVPNDSYRFTDHYQGDESRLAIYVPHAANHYGNAIVAHDPGKSDLDSAPDATNRLHLDVDRTPYLGTGCAGKTKFAGQTITPGQCENSIDEGAGGGLQEPTWILVQLPGKSVPGTQSLFYDNRGIMLDDIHVKWPADNPANERPDFAQYATAHSNLDNDAETDYQELVGCGDDIVNPTNNRTTCNDVDGDSIPKGTPGENDRSPDPAVVLTLRATKANGAAIPAVAPFVPAPFEADLLYSCKVNRGSITSASIDLGSAYNGLTTRPATALDVPVANCDGIERRVRDLPGAGANPTYVYLKSTAAPQQTITPTMSAVHADGLPVPVQSTTFKIEGTTVLTLAFVGDSLYAPVDFTGSKATCQTTHTFQSGEFAYGLDPALGDQLNGSPAGPAGCSAAGTDTAFKPIYYHKGGTPNDRFMSVTARFTDANVVTVTAKLPVQNDADSGTLAATGCTGPCYSNAPSIVWHFTPTTLADESGQGWESVTLKRGAATLGAMTFNAGANRYEYTESGRAVGTTYNAVILDEGRRVSDMPAVTLAAAPNPNALPTVDEFQAPREAGYGPDAAPEKTTVDTHFFARATDNGPAGRAADTGEPLTTFQVKLVFLTATSTVDDSPLAVPNPVTLTALPTCPSTKVGETAVNCPATDADGKTNNGEVFRGSTKLSPMARYTYKFTATDSGAATASSPTKTLGDAINADEPTATTPAVAAARPFSFAFLIAGGSAGIVTQAAEDQLANLQAFLDETCGQPMAGPQEAQPCAERVLYETVCGLPPGDHEPADLAECKDAQELVADLVSAVFSAVNTLACSNEHHLADDCASWRVGQVQENATAAIALLRSTVCGPAPQLCAEGPLEIPLLNPAAILTDSDCDFLEPDQWQGGAWNDSCNSGSITDPGAFLTGLVEDLLAGEVPVLPLPVGDVGSHNLPDASGSNSGSSDAPNGQADFVETRILGYRFDSTDEDVRDPFDGDNADGVTLFLGNLGPQSQLTDPKRGFTVRVGDVAGTPMQEILVIEDVRTATPKVTCLIIAPSPGTIDSPYVREGAHRFRQNGDSPLGACGASTRSGALRYDYIDQDGLDAGTIGLMVWEDRDGSGSRTDGNDADASVAGASTEDIVGFRLQMRPGGMPALRIDVNQLGTVTTRTTPDDGLVARIMFPDLVAGPIMPGTEAAFILVGEDAVHIEADVYSQQADTWAPHDGPVTLFLQRDCQQVGRSQEHCYVSGSMENFTVQATASAQPGNAGHYHFSVGSAEALDKLFTTLNGTMVPVSAVHVWIQDGARQSNYALPTRLLMGGHAGEEGHGQPPAENLTRVDVFDGSLWTPVPVLAASLDVQDVPTCTPQPTAAEPAGDLDGDEIPNACDPTDDRDTDLDGVKDGTDNCPAVANVNQVNSDGANDGGDACDDDDDNDGKSDAIDQCPRGASTGTDTDGDGCKDATEDSDDDGDNVADGVDDPDADGPIQAGPDNCPVAVNTDQADNDGDASGDMCDTDDDNDGRLDTAEPAAGTSTTNPDSDADGFSDGSADPDGAGPIQANDNCPAATNPGQSNTDNANDGGDACDGDDDNDGDVDGEDNCPLVSNSNQLDTDKDAQGDACDTDDDNDGFSDTSESNAGSNPLVAASVPGDKDGDQVAEGADDPDGDGPIVAGPDNCPLVSNTDQADADQDGTGNVCEADQDGDGVEDGADNCPAVANANQANMDGDAKGDVCDDSDSDGKMDNVDACPQSQTLVPEPQRKSQLNMTATNGCFPDENPALKGDGFVAAVGLPDAPLPTITLDGAAKSFTVTVYNGGVAAGSGQYTLYVQVDCGPLQPTVTTTIDCAGDLGQNVNDGNTLKQVFTASASGTTVTFTAAQMESLLQDPLPATAVHVFVLDAAGSQSNYALPTAALIELELFAAADLVDETAWTPVPVLAESAVPTLPPCEDNEVGVTGEACIDDPTDPCEPETGPMAPVCLPVCDDNEVGVAGDACVTPPGALACLADDSCVAEVTDALCAQAGTPGATIDDCVAALPNTVAEALCEELKVCAEDGDGDGIPDDADKCDGNNLDPEDCPAPEPPMTDCSDETTVLPGVPVSICRSNQGGDITRLLGLRGVQVRAGGIVWVL